jgi:Ca2+-binding EF-hand superfamily protein
VFLYRHIAGVYVLLLRQLVWPQMDALSFKKMDFPEFCAAAISVHQLEATDKWERHACAAYDIFEKEGNRVISVEELARVSSYVLLDILLCASFVAC